MVSQAMALDPGFVPVGVSHAELETTQTSYNSFYTSGSDTSSAIRVIKSRNGVGEDDISGSVSYETTTLCLKYQYGLLETVNLGVRIPFISAARKSDLTLNNSAYSSFQDSIDDADASGVGDVEIIALWQPIFTDVTNLQIGFILDGNNGAYHGDDNNKMALGSGANEVSAYLRWLLFSIYSRLAMSLELEYQLTAVDTVKDSNGKSISISRENSSYVTLDVGTESGSLGYGGGIHAESVGTTNLDGVSQKDSHIGYSVRAFLTIGNLHQLEQQH